MFAFAGHVLFWTVFFCCIGYNAEPITRCPVIDRGRGSNVQQKSAAPEPHCRRSAILFCDAGVFGAAGLCGGGLTAQRVAAVAFDSGCCQYWDAIVKQSVACGHISFFNSARIDWELRARRARLCRPTPTCSQRTRLIANLVQDKLGHPRNTDHNNIIEIYVFAPHERTMRDVASRALASSTRPSSTRPSCAWRAARRTRLS